LPRQNSRPKSARARRKRRFGGADDALMRRRLPVITFLPLADQASNQIGGMNF
jgi:hypothetical protein